MLICLIGVSNMFKLCIPYVLIDTFSMLYLYIKHIWLMYWTLLNCVFNMFKCLFYVFCVFGMFCLAYSTYLNSVFNKYKLRIQHILVCVCNIFKACIQQALTAYSTRFGSVFNFMLCMFWFVYSSFLESFHHTWLVYSTCVSIIFIMLRKCIQRIQLMNSEYLIGVFNMFNWCIHHA